MCDRVRPCVPCVSRLPPVSFYRFSFYYLPVKRHRGEPGHTRDTRDTRDTRAHAGTRITRTNLTRSQPSTQTIYSFSDTTLVAPRLCLRPRSTVPASTIILCIYLVDANALLLSRYIGRTHHPEHIHCCRPCDWCCSHTCRCRPLVCAPWAHDSCALKGPQPSLGDAGDPSAPF